MVFSARSAFLVRRWNGARIPISFHHVRYEVAVWWRLKRIVLIKHTRTHTTWGTYVSQLLV